MPRYIYMAMLLLQTGLMVALAAPLAGSLSRRGRRVGACAAAASVLAAIGVTYGQPDRKSTRLNSSHSLISYSVFCLKKQTTCTVDPNFGRLLRNRRHIHILQNTSPFSYIMRISVRSRRTAVSRSPCVCSV